jgi:hypothetical protein
MDNKRFFLIVAIVIVTILFSGCEQDNGGSGTEYQLTIESWGNGHVQPVSGTFEKGTEVTLYIYPDSGWYFDSWGGPDAADVVDNVNGTFSILMDANKSLTAIFKEGVAYNLFINITGEGSVNKNPSEYSYSFDTVVTLTPDPGPGWYFDSWEGANAADVDNNGNGTYSITMDGNKTIEAIFSSEYRQLTVYSAYSGACSGATSAEIVLDPSGGLYKLNTEVTITITWGPHTTFDGWNGENKDDIIVIDQENGIYSIIMDGDKSIDADFGLIMYSLAITIYGYGHVEETSNCHNYFSGTSSNDYVEDFTVILSPQPEGGATFDRWGGDDVDDIDEIGGGAYSITIDADKSIEAYFITK